MTTPLSIENGNGYHVDLQSSSISLPPILDKLPISRRSNKAWWMQTKEERLKCKFDRAYQRCMLGLGFEGEYILLTLTTPEGCKEDIHNCWEKWVKRMRRRGYILEYYAVKEWNEKGTCIHIHVILRLDYISYNIAREQWKAVTGAVWIHVDRVHTAKGMANYISKYLLKGYKNNPGKRGYWYSSEWINPKWHAFNKAMYKHGISVTPTESELIHNLKDKKKRKDYMNWRMADACLGAIRAGTVEGGEIELTQFKY